MPAPDPVLDRSVAVILCVEDEESLRTDICDELKDAGYTVLEAADGHEALNLITSAHPDLILCDINMPGRNGYDILKTVREQRPDLADTPFVFLSALSHPHEIIEGKKLGADDYLVKPIDFDLLLATVNARLRQIRRIKDKSEREVNELRQAMKNITTQALTNASRALDLVSPGVLLFDRKGDILYANRAAHIMAKGNQCLRLDTTLTTALTSEARQLRKAILEAINTKETAREKVRCLSLARKDGGRPLLAFISSLDQTMPDGPAAVLLLADPDRRVRLPQQVIAKLFGLTPTESRIALALAEGQRTDEIAVSMGISMTTVAFHLRNLFQKTDTNRQADLIVLILAASMTFALEE